MIEIIQTSDDAHVYVDIEDTFRNLRVGDVLVDIFYFQSSYDKMKLCYNKPISIANDSSFDILMVTSINRCSEPEHINVVSIRFPAKFLILKRSLCRYAPINDIVNLIS